MDFFCYYCYLLLLLLFLLLLSEILLFSWLWFVVNDSFEFSVVSYVVIFYVWVIFCCYCYLSFVALLFLFVVFYEFFFVFLIAFQFSWSKVLSWFHHFCTFVFLLLLCICCCCWFSVNVVYSVFFFFDVFVWVYLIIYFWLSISCFCFLCAFICGYLPHLIFIYLLIYLLYPNTWLFFFLLESSYYVYLSLSFSSFSPIYFLPSFILFIYYSHSSLHPLQTRATHIIQLSISLYPYLCNSLLHISLILIYLSPLLISVICLIPLMFACHVLLSSIYKHD